MSGTVSASIEGVRRWISPGFHSSGRPSGTRRSFSSSSASSPITTTIRGCTMAISSRTRARQAGAESSVSCTGHFTNTVPYTASGSIPRRLKLFMSALPARP
jgi:hypothetical protein